MKNALIVTLTLLLPITLAGEETKTINVKDTPDWDGETRQTADTGRDQW